MGIIGRHIRRCAPAPSFELEKKGDTVPSKDVEFGMVAYGDWSVAGDRWFLPTVFRDVLKPDLSYQSPMPVSCLMLPKSRFRFEVL